jgi:hypothetical protein
VECEAGTNQRHQQQAECAVSSAFGTWFENSAILGSALVKPVTRVGRIFLSSL